MYKLLIHASNDILQKVHAFHFSNHHVFYSIISKVATYPQRKNSIKLISKANYFYERLYHKIDQNVNFSNATFAQKESSTINNTIGQMKRDITRYYYVK